MDTSQKKPTARSSNAFTPFALLFLVLLLMMPRSAKFAYDYKKGTPWGYETLVAQFDFPIYKTDEQIMAERVSASSIVIPYYKYSDDVVNHSLKTAESISYGSFSSLKPRVLNSLRSIYSQGVIQDEISRADKRAFELSEEVLYIQKDKRATKVPYSEVYRQADAKAKLIADVSSSAQSVNLDSLFRHLGIYDLVEPNLIFDRQTTELVQSESVMSVSPTQGYVKSGEVIVSEGELVTAEIAQMLDSYKLEYRNNVGSRHTSWQFWLGSIIIALVIVLLVCLVIIYVEPSLFDSRNKLYYICFIYFLVSLGVFAVGREDQTFIYLVPFALGIFYLRTFFSYRLVLPLYFVCLLPMAVFRQNGIVLMVMYLLAGAVSTLFFKTAYRGWKQFLPSWAMFLVLLLTYLGFNLVDMITGDWLRVVLFMFIGSLISSMAYPLTYVFERIFHLLSQTRLAELADTDSLLMRRFEEKAPGTFQHCLHVMSMAETVTRLIGGDVALVRAGAMYHDIGKTRNPLCFVENSSLTENVSEYHSKLDPKQSAHDIIRHVSDGLDLADKHNLPEAVKDFILTHHGTSVMSYFYTKHVNDGGDPGEISEFTYPGRKPQTKEQVVLMLCDTIEAASRTLKDNSAKGYSEFVDKIIESKAAEGQFEEADITFRELEIVRESLKTFLAQMNHGRIEYPKRRRKFIGN